ncbi:SixA phosphatase family protein [Elongatibacter sediminis]|uniref:Phosphohistidine phosphatase n=1 Tax=Elongatibacter sediminis TaxID=3119006 RepID=A0AAW9RKP3_9GAMM
MQQLSVLRHAKAVPWTPRQDDFARSLRPIGAEHARRIADWMLEHLELPGRILCSPSQRTRETLSPLLRRNPDLEAVTQFVPQMYQADAATLCELLDAAFSETDRVLIIGHNPSFERLVGDVIAERHRDEFRRLPTGTLAVVDFDPDWFGARTTGRLAHLVRGKHLSVD